MKRANRHIYRANRQYIKYESICTVCQALYITKRPKQSKRCPECAKCRKAEYDKQYQQAHVKQERKDGKQYIFACVCCGAVIVAHHQKRVNYCDECREIVNRIYYRLAASEHRNAQKDRFYRADNERVLTEHIGRLMCEYECECCPFEDCILSED